MIDKTFAQHFANHWIAAWNSHDLAKILAHYDDAFSMTSPVIVQLMAEPSGTLQGKTAVATYWQTALNLMPDLQFELINVLTGINSIILYYKSIRGIAAEVFYFNEQRKVINAFAHYD